MEKHDDIEDKSTNSVNNNPNSRDNTNESSEKEFKESLKKIKIARIRTTTVNYCYPDPFYEENLIADKLEYYYPKMNDCIASGDIVRALQFCQDTIMAIEGLMKHKSRLIMRSDAWINTYLILDDFCKFIEQHTDSQSVEDEVMMTYLRAGMLREKMLREYHIVIANAFSYTAGKFQSEGEYDKAIEYYEKALVIRERFLGREHSDLAETYYYMARVYEEQNNYDRALEIYKTALTIIQKDQSMNYRFMATVYLCIGRIYIKKTDYNNALTFYEKALSIYKEKLGPNHPDTNYVLKLIDEVKK